jgi:hypothetical protein
MNGCHDFSTNVSHALSKIFNKEKKERIIHSTFINSRLAKRNANLKTRFDIR